jgi:glucose-6-phosphate dehydrogenase assembly protein OpcA
LVSRDEYRAILSGEAWPVDVVAVERELTGLWKAAAVEDEGGSGAPVVRACVLNLVAYAGGEEAGDRMKDMVSQVSGRHPNRSIIIVGRPQGPSAGLSAAISAHCQVPPSGGKQVCSEQVILNASGSAVDEVHGTVLPLLVSDLPVFLWWHDEPPLEGHLFRELLESADRLLIDSADFPADRAAEVLAGLRNVTNEENVPLSDLNWSRLTHWRELVAQFFDGAPGRPYLDRLDRVRVAIASIHGPDTDFTEGLFIVGWLASRLDWELLEPARPAGEGGMALALRGPAGPIEVELKPDHRRAGEGLHSVSLHAGADATFSVARKVDDLDCVLVTAELPEGAGHSRVVRMDVPPDGALLCDELDVLGRDTVFEEALGRAIAFMGGER